MTTRQIQLTFNEGTRYGGLQVQITRLEKDIIRLVQSEPGITAAKMYSYFPNKYTTKAALVRLAKLGKIRNDGFLLYINREASLL